VAVGKTTGAVGAGVVVGVGEDVGTGVEVGVGGDVGTGVEVGVGGDVGTGAGVSVGLAAKVGAGIAVAVGEGLGVGTGVAFGSTPEPFPSKLPASPALLVMPPKKGSSMAADRSSRISVFNSEAS